MATAVAPPRTAGKQARPAPLYSPFDDRCRRMHQFVTRGQCRNSQWFLGQTLTS